MNKESISLKEAMELKAKHKLYRDALNIWEGACNIGAILRSTVDSLNSTRDVIGYCNKDPAIRLIIAQLAHLAKTDGSGALYDENGRIEYKITEEIEQFILDYEKEWWDEEERKKNGTKVKHTKKIGEGDNQSC